MTLPQTRATAAPDRRREKPRIVAGEPDSYFSRELSWLAFAARVLAMVEDADVPLMERARFAGIMGMLHDEFFMKRASKLMREIRQGILEPSLDGRLPQDELDACRAEIRAQSARLDVAVGTLRARMAELGVPLLDHAQLTPTQQRSLRRYFERSVEPILTPLAVDPEHPFPFISNHGLNLAVYVPTPNAPGGVRFVRIKVPGNRPRWVPVPGGRGWVPLEQVIAANLDLTFGGVEPRAVSAFRVTRSADGMPAEPTPDELSAPGAIVQVVSGKLRARRFAPAVRLQTESAMPAGEASWLAERLEIGPEDVYPTGHFLGLADLMSLDAGREDLRYPRHEPVTHPRLRSLPPDDSGAIFDEIRRGDILVHHPYHSFDTSVLRFLESAAADPAVLAIKLTIYRTSSHSAIVRALAEASRLGKQVAVLVEITARFDEAPNIAWGELLEGQGAHVAYGVEHLKTHVKLALVVRQEGRHVRRYAHVGTGNYHTGTARAYEDLGILTADSAICADVAAVFNALTGSMPHQDYRKMLVAPVNMRDRFVELVRREAEHARAGLPSGIQLKVNQLEDHDMIAELYRASQAGVPIDICVRGLCCLRPGVPGLSETVRVWGIIGRFLEHGRIFRFENGGQPEYFVGSADWMSRNLERRVETVMPVEDAAVRSELDRILAVYRADNDTAWDCLPDGTYLRRRPGAGEPRRGAQEAFIDLARRS